MNRERYVAATLTSVTRGRFLNFGLRCLSPACSAVRATTHVRRNKTEQPWPRQITQKECPPSQLTTLEFGGSGPVLLVGDFIYENQAGTNGTRIDGKSYLRCAELEFMHNLD